MVPGLPLSVHISLGTVPQESIISQKVIISQNIELMLPLLILIRTLYNMANPQTLEHVIQAAFQQ